MKLKDAIKHPANDLNEKFLGLGRKKQKPVSKSYRERLFDDPKYVDKWLQHDWDEAETVAKTKELAKRGIEIHAMTPEEVHAKRLYKYWEEGGDLTKDQEDFVKEHGYKLDSNEKRRIADYIEMANRIKPKSKKNVKEVSWRELEPVEKPKRLAGKQPKRLTKQ
jgi:hypothetical protein